MVGQGEPHKVLGLFETEVHLFGVDEPGGVFLFGTDSIGRDVFSRTFYAARLSLSIGLVGVALSFLIGVILGGVSGYFRFLEAILNPLHEEHKKMLEWAGRKYDPYDFDPENVHFDNPRKRWRRAFQEG